MTRRAVLGFLLAGAGACSSRATPSARPLTSASEQVIALERVADTMPERWTGLTNIFFSPLADSASARAQLDAGWTTPEIADVVRDSGLVTILVVRFREPGDSAFHYVVDTTGRLDFVHGRRLTFRRRDDVLVADVDLEVRSRSGASVRLPYQILASDDGYTYARIAEYRRGRFRVGEREFAIKVQSASRNEPFFTLSPGTTFMIDLDGDGTIAEQNTITAGDRPMAAEQVIPSAPFVVSGAVLEFAAIDSAGRRLVVRPSRTRVAAVEGLEAPVLRGESLDGSRFRLDAHASAVTLIEFWSTECAFSERARPAANALAAEARAAGFTWVAPVKENDRATVRRHLAEHPMGARVVFADSSTWSAYDPAIITPLFIVVDRQGIVRYRAAGASAITAVGLKVRELLH